MRNKPKMRFNRWKIVRLVAVGVTLGPLFAAMLGQTLDSASASSTRPNYYGFDRNDYPGDENLSWLRKTFVYTGFWLNPPPGAASNSWAGKRGIVEQAGFGFLVLFDGRLDAELKKSADASKLGEADAVQAIEAARREGFPPGTVIFLDIEEGGRMLPEQKAYIYAWADGVTAKGFRAGIYCSGIPASEGRGVTVVTARDLREHAGERHIVYWVANDACPPAPGCGLPKPELTPNQSGVEFAEVWQFAQSPRRREMTQQCVNKYGPDQNCNAPGGPPDLKVELDLDTASEDDPSHGRTRPKGEIGMKARREIHKAAEGEHSSLEGPQLQVGGLRRIRLLFFVVP